jgi:hypothetical protein
VHSLGSCVAAGHYAAVNAGQQAIVAMETSGAWGQASALTLPSDALGIGPLSPPGAQCGATTCLQAASLESVACTSVGNCAAVGDYVDDSTECDSEASADACAPIYEAMAATETSGVWQQATSVGDGDTGIELSALEAVACTGPGSCVAVGQQSFIEPFMGGATYEDYPAALAAETGAVWGHVSAATLPPGAASFELPSSFTPTPGGPEGPGEHANLDAVTCTSPGRCVAVGAYLDGASSTQAMVLSSVASLALLTKHTISTRQHSAKFSFTAEGEASGFQCALVRVGRGKHKTTTKPRYATCRTSKRYTKLRAGGYIFYVRTIEPGGTDKTPASYKFKIT